ncbi:MAG: rRNA maturation RNase YbeY [Silvanigrellales bacterium]|nr:rRNA maturation RNase YbeY [Silvanigrellales bacterium]
MTLPLLVNLSVACRHFERLDGKGRCLVTLDKVALRARVGFALNLLCDSPSSVNVRFCDAEEMRHTNAAFRGKDAPTDVLSFPAVPGFSDTTKRGRLLYSLGDLLVCLPVCERQARAHRLEPSREVEKMILHGLVHLKGFDHELSDASWRVMSSLEKALSREVVRAMGQPRYVTFVMS